MKMHDQYNIKYVLVLGLYNVLFVHQQFNMATIKLRFIFDKLIVFINSTSIHHTHRKTIMILTDM
jgi:hypothetical protein